MIREDGMMLAKLDNTKGKDGFRTEEWRDLYEHAAEHMLKHMKKRSKDRGVERCRVTITKEELVELIKRSPCTPFFDAARRTIESFSGHDQGWVRLLES